MQNQENGTLQNHPTRRTQNIHKFTKWIEPQRHNTRQSDIRVVEVTAVEEKVGQKKNSWRNKGQNFPQINQTYTFTDVRCWTDHQAGPAREGPWRRTAQSRSRRPESKATSWPQKEKKYSLPPGGWQLNRWLLIQNDGTPKEWNDGTKGWKEERSYPNMFYLRKHHSKMKEQERHF